MTITMTLLFYAFGPTLSLAADLSHSLPLSLSSSVWVKVCADRMDMLQVSVCVTEMRLGVTEM